MAEVTTLVDAFQAGLKKSPDGTALLFDDSHDTFTLTYREIDKHVHQVKSHLQ